MPTLHSTAGVGDQCNRGGVAFQKAVAVETSELLEGLLRGGLLVAIGHHAGDELVTEGRDAAGELEGRLALAELVGFAQVKPAQTIATSVACSWKSGTPSVLPSTCSNSDFG